MLTNTPLDFYIYVLTQTASLGWSRALPTDPFKSGIACSVMPMGASEQDGYYRRREINCTHAIYSNYDFDANISYVVDGKTFKGIRLGQVFKDPKKGFLYQVRAFERYEQPSFGSPLVYKIAAERIVA